MDLKIARFADLHIGRKGYPAGTYYRNELMPMLDYLEEMPQLDYIEIAGDTGDRLHKMNSEMSIYYHRFFSRLCEIADRKNAVVRILEGTPNHDAGMLESVKHFERTAYNFKIINKACWEEVLPGFTVLFLPHETVENPEIYYSELFSRTYDICTFHGTIEGTAWYLDSQKQYGFHHNKRALVFSLEAIRNIATFASGGHIHTRMKLCDNVWYIGATTTLTRDDNEVKGFEVVDYNTETKVYSVQHILNPNVRKFKTFIITEILNRMKEEELYAYMKKSISIPDTIINFVVNRPDLSENGLLNLRYIKSMFAEANIEVKAKVKEEEKQKIEEELKMAEKCVDETIPIEDILHEFILENHGDENVPDINFIREFIGVHDVVEI